MKNVLLVDDDPVAQFLGKKQLIHAGIAQDGILIASNGLQAIELLLEYSEAKKPLPELILLDLNMPVLDGFGFLEAFQGLDGALRDQVKIVVVSSSDNADDMRRSRELGASDYMIKPLNADTLVGLLDLQPAC
ncbi:MAG TPA: response regulator [Chryseolinea sp.]